jgi:hypothetical protein
MSKFKADIIHALGRAGLIFALAGGSELISQIIAYYTSHNVNTFVDKAIIMSILAYAQKFLSAQLVSAETSGL